MPGEQKSPSPDDERNENLCQVSPQPSSDTTSIVPGPGVQANGGRGRLQEMFGDPYLGAVMVVLLLLHLLQNGMRDPCTCWEQETNIYNDMYSPVLFILTPLKRHLHTLQLK
jgi:hypothetical protein